ncbi:sensor histidine kinase [Christensenellaceae bacterium OttesenSCG-928-K19]|nr:sensor histidine kinase [Christensenellaceae bacterium OttesenSCG-928-K19]
MLKQYRLRAKMMLAFLVFAIIPAVIMSMVYYATVKNSELERIAEFMLRNVHNMSDNIEINLLNVERSKGKVISDEELIDSLSLLAKEEGGYELKVASDYLTDYLLDAGSVNDFISNIYILNHRNSVIYAARGRQVYFADEFEPQDWYSLLPVEYEEFNQWVATYELQSGGNVIALYKPIVIFQSSERIGVFSFLVEEAALRREIELKNDYGADIMIVDGSGRYISHPSTDQIGKTAAELESVDSLQAQGFQVDIMDGEETLTVFYQSEYTNWRYLSRVPVERVLSSMDVFRNFSFTIILLMIALMFGWSYFINRLLYQPVVTLTDYMKKMEGGDFSIRIPNSRNDEMGYIYSRYNDMMENVQKLINDLYIQRILRQQAQLNAIETEINEHFLHNTLDAARWMIRTGQYEGASVLLFKLSQLFRQSLNVHDDVTTVAQVIQMLENYIDIISLRYGDRFECTMQADEALLECRVLKFIFQPLVENAVVHGMEGSARKLELKVAFEERDGLLVFSVWDNGKGISPGRMEEITRILDAGLDAFDDQDCFALKNINMQIKLYYGEEYGLHIESKEYNGTLASFAIPKKPLENEGSV